MNTTRLFRRGFIRAALVASISLVLANALSPLRPPAALAAETSGALTISAPLSIEAPGGYYAGAPFRLSYSVRNATGSAVTADIMAVTVRGPSDQNLDIACDNGWGVTIAPGATWDCRATHTYLSFVGQYRLWANWANGRWHDGELGSTQVMSLLSSPVLAITRSLNIEAVNGFDPGSPIRLSYSVRNATGSAVTADIMAVTVRGPSDQNLDIACDNGWGVTIAPGATWDCWATHTYLSFVGQYRLWANWDANGRWHDGELGPAQTISMPADTPEDRARRAFERVLGPVNGDNFYYYNSYVFAARDGASYDELVTRITRDYVTQAYSQIFRYRNDPNYSPSTTAVQFNEQVFQNVLQAVRGTGPLGTLAIPEYQAVRLEPATIAETIWGYVARQAGVWGAHDDVLFGQRLGELGGEKCLGAMGPGCAGLHPAGWANEKPPSGVERFRRMDGREMHYIENNVAVGSILHDKSCRPVTWEAYCQGEKWRDGYTEDEMHWNGLVAGEGEWRKAWWNTSDGRYWRYRFGPYPYQGSEDPFGNFEAPGTGNGITTGSPASRYQDDIRPRENRPTMMTEGESTLTIPYRGGEYAATTVLFATLWTKIDSTDDAFCGTGNVTATESAWGAVDWKHCVVPSGGGGGGGGGKGGGEYVV